MLSFAEHLILSCDGSVKASTTKLDHTTPFSLLLTEGALLVCKCTPKQDWHAIRRGNASCLMLIAPLWERAHSRSEPGDVHNVFCLLLAVTIHLTGTSWSISQWLKSTGSKMLDASARRRYFLWSLGGCEAGLWCIILACFSFGLFWVDMNEMS